MNISEVTDAQVINCMLAHGGSFVRALAAAAARADAENLRIIKTDLPANNTVNSKVTGIQAGREK